MGDIETLVTQKRLKANNMMDNAKKEKFYGFSILLQTHIFLERDKKLKVK